MERIFLKLIKFCTVPIFLIRLGMASPDIQLTDLNIYSELKSKLSGNTNLAYQPYEVFQEVSFKIKSHITEKLSAWIHFKSEYVQFHWKKEDRFLFINAGAVEYNITPVAKLIFGSIYVNYSPFIAMSYPWVINLFRGIGFEYKTYRFYLHTFIANNGDNPDESTWEPPVNFDLDYRLIDLGYESETKSKQYPTLWGGCKLKYTFQRNPVFTPTFAFIYIRENYTKKDYPAGYVDVNDNNVFGIEFNFNLLDYVLFKNTGAVTLNKTDKYTVYTNYFGEGKHKLDFLRMDYDKYYAYKTRMEINDLFYGLFKQYNTFLFFEYEKVDPYYHPTYMNQNLDNRTINPYENIYSGREGFWAGIEQNIGYGFFIGIGYQRYLYKWSYYHNFPDGSIFTEKQIILKNQLYKTFRLFFIYQIREMERGTLPEGGKRMNSFYLRIQSDIIDNVYFEIEYNKNKNYYENYDEVLLKFLVWGW